jgi:hypothetical protein
MDGSVSRPPNQVLIGPTTDIGNVNMTDPGTLRAFVQWAEQTAPSQHTMLVLWNHGGDEYGLIEDDTSAPGSIMSLSQLTSALSGLPTFDILYFEMCLMAGYEPLSAVRNVAQTVVASEDEEIVNGWDFSRLLSTIYANPTGPAPTLAGSLADSFDAAFANLPWSETISAFNMTGFGAVDAAVSQLATALTNSASVTATGLATEAFGVQRYGGAPWVADLVDLSDTLRAHISDPTVAAAASAVRQSVTSSAFLLNSHFRNGTQYGQRNESRSRGLTIVMPSTQPDELPSNGVASVAAYTQQFPTSAWTTFLQRYTGALASQQYVNFGNNRLVLYEVWNQAVVGKAQVEMLLLEPDGTLSGPAIGSVSPSGEFSADAQSTNSYYEWWESNQYVESGKFYFLAWLATDPNNIRPLVNVVYQIGSGSQTSLYGTGTYPQLSLARSFQNDPNATWASVLAGNYTDLRPVSTWNTGSSTSTETLARLPSAVVGVPLLDQDAAPHITDAQLATLKRIATGELRPARRMSSAVGASRRRTPQATPPTVP